MKVCSKCKRANEFYQDKTKKSGFKSQCKVCFNAYRKSYVKTSAGRSQRMWDSLNRRAENRDGNNPSYKNVKVLMNREEFLKWAIPEVKKFFKLFPNNIPSLDRYPDVNGDYSINNIRIIEVGLNSKLRPQNKNSFAPLGMAWCSKCEAYLSKDKFNKNSKNSNKVGHICKTHTREYNHLNYINKKLKST